MRLGIYGHFSIGIFSKKKDLPHFVVYANCLHSRALHNSLSKNTTRQKAYLANILGWLLRLLLFSLAFRWLKLKVVNQTLLFWAAICLHNKG